MKFWTTWKRAQCKKKSIWKIKAHEWITKKSLLCFLWPFSLYITTSLWGEITFYCNQHTRINCLESSFCIAHFWSGMFWWFKLHWKYFASWTHERQHNVIIMREKLWNVFKPRDSGLSVRKIKRHTIDAAYVRMVNFLKFMIFFFIYNKTSKLACTKIWHYCTITIIMIKYVMVTFTAPIHIIKT